MHKDRDLMFYIDNIMVLHDTTPIQPYKTLCNGRFVYWEHLIQVTSWAQLEFLTITLMQLHTIKLSIKSHAFLEF